MALLWNLALLVALSYTALNLYLFWQRRKFRHLNSLPIPLGPLWFLGIVPDINRRAKLRPLKNFPDLFSEYHQETGWDVFVIHLFIRDIIFCVDLGIIAPVLTDNKTFLKTRDIHRLFAWVAGVRMFGEYGLLNDPGTEVWRAKRRIMDPAFHKNFLRTTMGGMNRVASKLIMVLESKEGTVFDVSYDLTRSAFEAIAICGFDWDEDQIEEMSGEQEEMVKMANVIVRDLATVFKERFIYNLPWRRREEKRYFRESVTFIRSIIRKRLQERLDKKGPQKDDILSYIIRGNSCSDQLTIEHIVDEYLTFVGAGMETSAITMAVTIFYLMTNKDIYLKAQKEVDEVFGANEELSFDDVNKLVYLDMVIKECLRISPPVAATGRECMKNNITIQGVHIPNGAFLFIPQNVLQNDPRYWENPDVFNPERFAPKAIAKIRPFTFMPFMAGQRSCIGKNFALLEMKIIISRMLHDFEIINPNPEVRELVTVGNITTRPLNGVKIRVQHRV